MAIIIVITAITRSMSLICIVLSFSIKIIICTQSDDKRYDSCQINCSFYIKFHDRLLLLISRFLIASTNRIIPITKEIEICHTNCNTLLGSVNNGDITPTETKAIDNPI